MLKLAYVVSSILAFVASPAQAYDWTTEAFITLVEPTYMPKNIVLQIDRTVGGCGVGTWYTWSGTGNNDAERWDNNRSVLAAMLTAQMSRTRVRIYGSNNGCKIEYIHILQN